MSRKVLQSMPPYTQAGFLETIFQDNTKGYATAFFIWHNVLLTACHNVFKRQENKFILSARFFPWADLRRCSDTVGYQVAMIFVPQQYSDQNQNYLYDHVKQYDYAMLILNTNDSLSKIHGKFKLKQSRLGVNAGGIYTIGFPNRKQQQSSIHELQRFQVGNVELSKSFIKYDAETAKGCSGGPILQILKNKKFTKYQLIGIHCGKYKQSKKKFGVRLNKSVFQRLEKWGHYINLPCKEKRRLKVQNYIGEDKLALRYFKSESGNRKLIFTKEKLYRNILTLISDINILLEIAHDLQYYSADCCQSRSIYHTILSNKQKYLSQKSKLKQIKLYHDLGRICNIQGQREIALDYLKKAIEINENAKQNYSENNHAILLEQIGIIQMNMKNYQQARKSFNKSLEITKRIYKGSTIQSASIYLNIGTMQLHLKNYDQAIRNTNLSLRIKEDCQKDNQKNFIQNLNNLGLANFEKGNFTQAKTYLNKSLNIYKSGKANRTFRVALTYAYLGAVFQKQKKFKQALKAFSQSKIIFENVLKEDIKNFNYLTLCKKIRYCQSNQEN